jgi:hypothetical protein
LSAVRFLLACRTGNKVLTSTTGGFWCARTSCMADTGTSSTWFLGTPPTPTATGAPAFSDWMLITLAVAIAAMGDQLLRKTNRDIPS